MTSTAANNASFVNKPARGWLHPDHLFAKDGINYAVRYIGCLEVNTSMKVLDFDTRSAIAKECISRVCESAGLKTVDKRRRPADKRLAGMLGLETKMQKAAHDQVQLTITSLALKISCLDSGNALFVHEMPNISFASGGDAETLDFVAYVAKDAAGAGGLRSCYVLECGGGLAQDVITTIGQAFELRFKEFLKRTPACPGAKPSAPPLHHVPASQPQPQQRAPPDDVEYYNDLPGKSAPAATQEQRHSRKQTATWYKDSLVPTTSSKNLIDFSTDISHPCPPAPFVVGGGGATATRPQPPPDHEYVNGHVANPPPGRRAGAAAAAAAAGGRDPFDMSPFATSPPCGGLPSPGSSVPAAAAADAAAADVLRAEEWYHGPISRRDAETLLQEDGDFLVRESQGSAGQYVLTGMQNNSKKHLLLVDPEGVVRTKDRTFESVSHLIYFHRNNSLPIISAESALRLQRPVAVNKS